MQQKEKRQKLTWIVAAVLILGGILFGIRTKRLYQEKLETDAKVLALQEENRSAEEELSDFGLTHDTIEYQGTTYKRNTYVKAILLMGIDRDTDLSEPQRAGEGGQSDGVFLIAEDTARDTVKILSIPRDTMTKIILTDLSGNILGEDLQHLTLAYAYGDGRELSCDYMTRAVTELLGGLQIDGYAAISMKALGMKIGILTHQYINNYGAFLQAWALREAIAELFPNDEVQIIDYVNLKHFIINAGGWFRFYKNRESFKDWMEKIKLPRTFAKARNQEMVLSKRCFNAKQINALDFDCIIVGSDEVWNYKDTKGNTALKFGEGLTCKNLIAYAPSVGKTTADESVPEYVIRGIKKFKKISARDDLTEQLVCNITGTAPERVLDPTFLAEFPRAELAARKKPYILFYYCENLPCNILNQIFSYAKEHGLAVYGAGECDKRYSEITVNLMPFEWVEMFRNAEFVFTGTFHGAVFSILNRRQFKVYLTNESRIKKVTALLEELGIQNRKMDSKFEFDLESMKNEINYDAVYRVINEKRQSSKQYLKDAIGMAKQ